MKKVLSVLLSVAMLIGCFSLFASAAVNDAVLKISFEPTAASYAKGDVVTFEVIYEADPAQLGNMGVALSFSVGFDSSVYEPVENLSANVLYSAPCASIVYAGYPVANNLVDTLSFVRVYDSSRLTAVDKAKGWDSVFFTSMTPTGACDDDYSTPKASFAFKLKIKDDANDAGCYSVGITDWSIQNDKTEIDEEVSSIYGADGSVDFGVTNIFELVDGTATVVSGPVVAYEKAQLKMTLINGNTDVDDEFQFRVTSIITDADWDAYFANTAAGGSTNAITDLGIVATKGTWNEADAKAVVNGTANAAYELATTDYVQKTSDTADAHFGAILKVKHSTTSSDVTYMGFVKYKDSTGAAQVIFYDAEKTAPLASNYDTYKANYISQYGA